MLKLIQSEDHKKRSIHMKEKKFLIITGSDNKLHFVRNNAAFITENR